MKIHKEMSKTICAVCWQDKKNSSLLLVTDAIEVQIRDKIYEGYNRDIKSYPSRICGTCKNNLYKIQRNETVPESWNALILKV